MRIKNPLFSREMDGSAGRLHVRITRKGFGESSKPALDERELLGRSFGRRCPRCHAGTSDRASCSGGHSLAGEELSSIGSRFPKKVSGLIYLDAAAGWAFYDPAHAPLEIEMNSIKNFIHF